MSKYFFNQQTPWISFCLLLVGYAVQSYLLAQYHQPVITYPIIVIGYLLLQIAILHSRTQRIRDTVRHWIGSDAIHVIVILVMFFLASFVLSYLEIFENFLFILAAEILARLDLQQTDLNQIQKIAVLTLCLTIGLVTGYIAIKLIA